MVNFIGTFLFLKYKFWYLINKDRHGADDDDGRRDEDAKYEIKVDHRLFDIPWWLLNNIRIYGLDAQRLRRRPIHDDVDPQNLHRIERIWDPKEGCNGDQRKGGDAPKNLKN